MGLFGAFSGIFPCLLGFSCIFLIDEKHYITINGKYYVNTVIKFCQSILLLLLKKKQLIPPAMNKLFNSILFTGLSLSLISCGGEDLDDIQAENSSHDLLTADITFNQADLVGTWRLESMISDTPVDFNDEDDVKNNNILLETNCFDGMNYVFDSAGNVAATQARLFFNSTGIETCNSGTYYATYELDGDQLKIYFTFNGTNTSEVKTIALSEDKQLLSISLTRAEASYYINDDSNTSTSVIGAVDLVYRKAN